MSIIEKLINRYCDCKQQVSKNLLTIETIKAEGMARCIPIGQESVKLEHEMKALEKDIQAYMEEYGIAEDEAGNYKIKLEMNYSLKLKPIKQKE